MGQVRRRDSQLGERGMRDRAQSMLGIHKRQKETILGKVMKKIK